MEIWMGGGSLNLEILRGGGAHAVSEFKVEGGSKKRAFRHGGVDFFWNNPMQTTCIYGHCFSPPITVYFSVGEKRRPETDLHLQATRACFLLETINTKFS